MKKKLDVINDEFNKKHFYTLKKLCDNFFEKHFYALVDQRYILNFLRIYTATNLYTYNYKSNENLFNTIDLSEFWKVRCEEARMMFLNLSLSFVYLKQYKIASEILEKNHQYRIQLAVNYSLMGDYKSAKNLYYKLLKKSDQPDKIFIYFNLFEIFLKENDKKNYKKYLALAEKFYLSLESDEYKVTRSYLLYNYYKDLHRLKAYSYFIRALSYKPIKDIDFIYKKKALSEVKCSNLLTVEEKNLYIN